MTFTTESYLVKLWSSMVTSSNQVPNLFNLREMVAIVLGEVV